MKITKFLAKVVLKVKMLIHFDFLIHISESIAAKSRTGLAIPNPYIMNGKKTFAQLF